MKKFFILLFFMLAGSIASSQVSNDMVLHDGSGWKATNVISALSPYFALKPDPQPAPTANNGYVPPAYLIITVATSAPSSSTLSEIGNVQLYSNHLYIAVSTNRWKRIQLFDYE